MQNIYNAWHRIQKPPYAEDEGVEPTDHLRGQGLANLRLNRSAYPPSSLIIPKLELIYLAIVSPHTFLTPALFRTFVASNKVDPVV